jgi:tungstate transport system ATP-binding protein
MLEARNISWKIGTKKILDNINLSLKSGSRVGIVGPNGSGKSSLLKVLSFLEPPTSGQIFFQGKKYNGRLPLAVRRKIGMVFQEPLLLNTTVQDNVGAGLRMRGLPRQDIQQRIREWLERFGVGHLEQQQARTLSGGEAQRVSLARAFALQPEILFMDEPFSALDAPAKEGLLYDLTLILPSTQTTTIIVSHDFREIKQLTERALIMLRGEIAADAPPGELLAGTPTQETEEFMKHWR